MDSVRLGRALGIGAREAAKAVVKAADAAAAASPAPAEGSRQTRFVEQAAATKSHVVETAQGLQRGGRGFGRAVWKPLAKVSGVLWLEVTGIFFGLFLLVAGANAWKLRGNLRDIGSNHTGHLGLVWSLVMAALFGYFCISSFVRAARRSRG